MSLSKTLKPSFMPAPPPRRSGDGILERPDPLDLHAHDVARLEKDAASESHARRRVGRELVAREQRHGLGHDREQFAVAVGQIVCARVLLYLFVHDYPDE